MTALSIRRRIEIVKEIECARSSGGELRYYSVLKEFIEREGLEWDYRDIQRRSALLYSVIYDDEAFFTTLINRGADIRDTDASGRTALHYCAISGTVHLARKAVECGVDINARDSRGNTALHLASTFSLAYEKCVYSFSGNEEEQDAASYDAAKGKQRRKDDVIRYLLETGADAGIRNLDGQTPSDIAAAAANATALELYRTVQPIGESR